MGGVNGSNIGRWALSTLTAVSLALAGFALREVVHIREGLIAHEGLVAHTQIDARVKQLELSAATGKRFVARDGTDILRLVERLARLRCEDPKLADAIRQSYEEIAEDAASLRAEITNRQR